MCVACSFLIQFDKNISCHDRGQYRKLCKSFNIYCIQSKRAVYHHIHAQVNDLYKYQHYKTTWCYVTSAIDNSKLYSTNWRTVKLLLFKAFGRFLLWLLKGFGQFYLFAFIPISELDLPVVYAHVMVGVVRWTEMGHLGVRWASPLPPIVLISLRMLSYIFVHTSQNMFSVWQNKNTRI